MQATRLDRSKALLLSIVDIDKQINLGHLLLNDRKCRVCGEIKNLVDGFYRTRKNRGAVASSYSYECKDCTIKELLLVEFKLISSVNGNILTGSVFTSCFPCEK